MSRILQVLSTTVLGAALVVAGGDVVGARKDQQMTATLMTEGNAYFNVLPPGSTGEAIYNGSIDGAGTTLRLPKDGDYTIRVYLMGAAKSEKRSVSYTVAVTIM